jgi:two-component system, NarL family, sensor kinase
VLEALTNVIRHAGAKSCRVGITLDEQRLTLQVKDAGRGLSPDFRPGVGMNAMRERVGELGGTLKITPVEGGERSSWLIYPCEPHEMQQTRSPSLWAA